MYVLRSIRLDYLLVGFLSYWMGAGIAHYLGSRIDWLVFLLGLLLLITILAATCLLNDSFGKEERQLGENVTLAQRYRLRSRLLQTALVLFTISSVFLLILVFGNDIRLSASVILVIFVSSLLLNTLPPLRLFERGFGELIVAFSLASLTPAFSFLLQAEELHKLNLIIALPLTLQAVAWQIASCFPSYARDIKFGRASLLIRLTWQRGLFLHHVSVASCVALFFMIPMMGLSWGLIWPVFLALPFIGLEVYWLQRIASGKEPVWKIFILLAPAAHALSIYLIALSLWIR